MGAQIEQPSSSQFCRPRSTHRFIRIERETHHPLSPNFHFPDGWDSPFNARPTPVYILLMSAPPLRDTSAAVTESFVI